MRPFDGRSALLGAAALGCRRHRVTSARGRFGGGAAERGFRAAACRVAAAVLALAPRRHASPQSASQHGALDMRARGPPRLRPASSVARRRRARAEPRAPTVLLFALKLGRVAMATVGHSTARCSTRIDATVTDGSGATQPLPAARLALRGMRRADPGTRRNAIPACACASPPERTTTRKPFCRLNRRGARRQLR